MKFIIKQEDFIKPLQRVANLIERRQTKPILGNILFSLNRDILSLTATDLEIEMKTSVQVQDAVPGEITVPARKLVDITRSTPAGAMFSFDVSDQKVLFKTGRSRFTLTTLPSSEYPNIEVTEAHASFKLDRTQLLSALEKTAFAMAQQDVRYYLNGMLFEINDRTLRIVTTDGHRLAIYDIEGIPSDIEDQRIIIPRKAILELMRFLGDGSEEIDITLGSNFIQVSSDQGSFLSKLINGIYPDYNNVIPMKGDLNAVCNRESLRQALVRVAILSNEQYRGVRMRFMKGNLMLSANNPDHEEAEESMEINYEGSDLDIGFNVAYLIDALSACSDEEVNFNLTDANSCCLIEPMEEKGSKYIIMPMRL